MSQGVACRRIAALAAGFLILAASWGTPGYAGEAGSRFNVHVTLGKTDVPPESPATEFCRSTNVPGAFGAQVTVVCSTGVVVDLSPGEFAGRHLSATHGGAYRFLLRHPWAGVMEDNYDLQSGLGTVTSWRVVHLADREYVELTVHW